MPARRRRHRGEMRLLDSELRAAAAFASGAAATGPPAMPSPPSRQSHYPGKAHLLRHAAEQGQLIFVKCTRCRRGAVYLATDLVTLLDPDRDALLPPFACSRCGTADAIRVDCRVHFSDEVGNLTIRRPGPRRVTQTWRSVKLGDG